MRVCGYDLDLLPYAEWCDVLRATSDDDHPLSGLRPFFLNTIADERYLTLPELFEESRRSHVRASRPTNVRQLDSHVLGRYFEEFIGRGVVPRAPRLPVASSVGDIDLRALLGAREVTLAPVDSDDSIVAELTSWRAGTRSGLFHATAIHDDGRESRVFVKAKSADSQMIEVAEALAALASSTLGDTVARFRNDLGLTHAHVRELEIYAMNEPALRAHMPAVAFIDRDDSQCRWLLGIESLDPSWMSGASDMSRWDDASLDATVDGVAAIHSAWFCRDAELRGKKWIVERTAERRIAMAPLWSALAEHAHEHSPAWVDHRLRRIHERLVRDVASWSHVLADAPRTLIHNDFNSRNIALRREGNTVRLCAFDWELATIGIPQRDLAELLCFVLPPDASLTTIARCVELHRTALARRTDVVIPRASWEAGFSAALCDVLVDRLASYAMIDRVRPQSFLPRVMRSWLNLFRHYPFV
jgi:aminoglycoside phosphotransferase (APT) family kinase protein